MVNKDDSFDDGSKKKQTKSVGNIHVFGICTESYLFLVSLWARNTWTVSIWS